MPIYDYVCSNCGHTMEVMHGVHGHGPAACPNCGGQMKKAYTPPAVHFRGTGWARKERSSTKARKAGPSSEGGDAKDSKPDAPAKDAD